MVHHHLIILPLLWPYYHSIVEQVTKVDWTSCLKIPPHPSPQKIISFLWYKIKREIFNFERFLHKKVFLCRPGIKFYGNVTVAQKPVLNLYFLRTAKYIFTHKKFTYCLLAQRCYFHALISQSSKKTINWQVMTHIGPIEFQLVHCLWTHDWIKFKFSSTYGHVLVTQQCHWCV